jgi:hypothetical protein
VGQPGIGKHDYRKQTDREWLAQSLFNQGAAERVIVAGLPKSRAAMHLNTVFSFCDQDLVTVFPEAVQSIVAFSLRPDESKPGGLDVRREEQGFLEVVAQALGLEKLRTVQTGGGSYEAEREQWDDGNNVVALEPGVVIGYDRNTFTNTLFEIGKQIAAQYPQLANRIEVTKVDQMQAVRPGQDLTLRLVIFGYDTPCADRLTRGIFRYWIVPEPLGRGFGGCRGSTYFFSASQSMRSNLRSQTPWPRRSPRRSNLVVGRSCGRSTYCPFTAWLR